METGLHLSSWGTVEDKDIAWLKQIGASTVTLLDGASRQDVIRIKDAMPDIKVVVRLYFRRGAIPVNYAETLAGDMNTVLEKYRPTDKLLVDGVIVLNEPDEDHAMSVIDAIQIFGILRPRLKARHPWAQLLLPGPSVNEGKLAYWAGLSSIVYAWDGLAEHAYWQTVDTRFHSVFGGRFKELHRLYPDKDIWLTEVGWKTGPGQLVSATAQEKGALYRSWATDVSQYDYVKGICFYRTAAQVETRPLPDTDGELEITQPLIDSLAGPVSEPTPIPTPEPVPLERKGIWRESYDATGHIVSLIRLGDSTG